MGDLIDFGKAVAEKGYKAVEDRVLPKYGASDDYPVSDFVRSNYDLIEVDDIGDGILGRTRYATRNKKGLIEIKDLKKRVKRMNVNDDERDLLMKVAEAVMRYVKSHEWGVEAWGMAGDDVRCADDYTWKNIHTKRERENISKLLEHDPIAGYVGLALHIDNHNTDEWNIGELKKYISMILRGNEEIRYLVEEEIKPKVDVVIGKKHEEELLAA